MNAYEQLQSYQIKPSVQRLAIMDYLLSNRTHPTVDEIYTALYPYIPTLSKTTVYNTLKLFAEHNAVQMITIDEKTTRFDVDTSPHGHFLCEQCAKIYDLEVRVSEKDLEALEKDGYQVAAVHYYYRGTCKECSRKD